VDAIEVLVEAFGRVPDLARAAVEGLPDDVLAKPPEAGANTIGWLVWHLARQQDAQVAALAGTEEVWVERGWAERAQLPFPLRENGYGMGAADVARVGLDAVTLLGYLDDVQAASLRYLRTLAPDRLDDVVDEDWDPPVTRGARLVSVVDDAVQHAGQAAYVRGLLERR
jgi:hypothetical protein